jgi:indole-3-glycerol phosphate synthase
MNRILEEIVAKKRKDLFKKKKLLSLEELKGQVKEVRGSELFYKAITRSINEPAVIAEVKFASPTNPNLGVHEELLSRVKQYEKAGADAISIITEKHFFKGDLSFVSIVKETVSLPVLLKDFVIDEYQIYESTRLRQGFGGQAGVDALLLIARLVDNKTLKQFVELCLAEGIEAVVEIYSEEDLEKAIETKTRFIAVNARDLDTFEVDVERACELMNKIPEKFIRVGFSGIQTAGEVRRYREAGARGVLVGTALMKTGNVGEFIEEIRK